MPVFTARCAESRGRYAPSSPLPSPMHKPSNKLSIEGMIYDAIMALVLSHLGQSLGEPMSRWRTFINESMFLILSSCSNILSDLFSSSSSSFRFSREIYKRKRIYSRRRDGKEFSRSRRFSFFVSFSRLSNFQICKDMSVRNQLG